MGCSAISPSHLFKIFDFVFQDDAVGSIWLLPGKGDAIFSYLPFFHTTDWRRCCKTGKKQNRQKPWLVRRSAPAEVKLVTASSNGRRSLATADQFSPLWYLSIFNNWIHADFQQLRILTSIAHPKK